MCFATNMDASGSHKANRDYYDAFAENYEAQRGPGHAGGYHELIDELESDYVRRYGTGRDVLEVGCGTGLVLSRIAKFARSTRGVDVSPKMLSLAQSRGLDVLEGSATALPFPDQSFDVVCAFKVLPHIADIENALAEMARVTRLGGMILAEFYNPCSIRGLVRRIGPKRKVAPGADESHVFTRFDSPFKVERLLPPDCHVVGSRGVRIVIPSARLMRVPVLGRTLGGLEKLLCDSPFKIFGGFWIAAVERRS